MLEIARDTASGKPASAECFDLGFSVFTLEAPGSPDDSGGNKPPLPIGGAVDIFDIEFCFSLTLLVSFKSRLLFFIEENIVSFSPFSFKIFIGVTSLAGDPFSFFVRDGMVNFDSGDQWEMIVLMTVEFSFHNGRP